MYQKRPYQATAVKKAYDSLNRYLSAVLVMATGTGKTETMHWVYQKRRQHLIAQGIKPRMILRAHRDELVRQPIDKAKNVFAPGEITIGGVKANQLLDFDREVICTSIQTLHRSPKKIEEILKHGPITDLYDDECHHVTAKIWRAVKDEIHRLNVEMWGFEGMVNMGVTATPHRHDEDNIAAVYPCINVDDPTNGKEAGKFTYVYPIEQAIADGYLTPLNPLYIKGVVDLSQVKFSKSGDANAKQMKDLYELGNWPEMIYKSWSDHAYGKPTLFFFPSVDIAKAFTFDWGERYGISTGCVSSKGCWVYSTGLGELVKMKRPQVIQMYRDGEIIALSNQSVLDEGFDAPVYCIVNAYPTESVGKHTQVVGRGTRPLKGVIDHLSNATAEERLAAIAASEKPHCELLYMNWSGHYLPSYKHAVGNMDLKQAAKLHERLMQLTAGVFKICPKCQQGNLAAKKGEKAVFICDNCGTEFVPDQMGLFDEDEGIDLKALLYDENAAQGVTYYAIALELFGGEAAAWYTDVHKQQFSLGLGNTRHNGNLVNRALFIVPPEQAQSGEFELITLYQTSKEWYKPDPEDQERVLCTRCKTSYHYSALTQRDSIGPIVQCPNCHNVNYNPWQVRQVYNAPSIEPLRDIAQEKWDTYGEAILSDKKKRWRKDPITAGQANYVRGLTRQAKRDATYNPITKGDGAQIITHLDLVIALRGKGYPNV